MHHLPQRMHAGVGTPGGHHADGLAGNAGQRFLQHRLHRRTVGLQLPAAVGAAVVLDAKSDPQNAGWRPPSRVQTRQQGRGLCFLRGVAGALNLVVNLPRRWTVGHADVGGQQVDLGVDRIAETVVHACCG